MAKFISLDNENVTNKNYKSTIFLMICIFALALSCIVLILKKCNDKSELSDYNLELQVSLPIPDNWINEKKYLDTFQKKIRTAFNNSWYIDYSSIKKSSIVQKIWIPQNFSDLDTIYIRFREFNNKTNDLTLKIKDLFRENIEKYDLKTMSNYEKIKRKIEMNFHWYYSLIPYTTFSWQQSVKIQNINFSGVNFLNYFPNNDQFGTFVNAKKNCITEYYYDGLLNNITVKYNIIFGYENCSTNIPYSISFEYKWYHDININNTKMFDKIGKYLLVWNQLYYN